MSDSKPYVSFAQIGNCKICDAHADLRCGVCFDCQDQVCGEQLSPTTHRLWDRYNPRNEWIYSSEHN